VERLSESRGVVTIAARSRTTQEEMEFDASRVYVACGVLSSSRLLLESLEAHGRPVTLLDAQHFMLPWLRYEGVEDPGGERLNTLAQVFLELSDRSLGPSGVHLQVYTYNDAYLAALRGMVGPLATQRSPVVRALLARTLVIQGYLDSSVSSRIQLTLERERDAGPHELVLEPKLNPNSKPIIKKVVSRLRRSRKLFRAIPASPLIRVGIPGAGSHCGGSFPMRESPGEFECDRLGRPTGFERVHVVDSTVFPSIPATTIALSAMANAHRIGSAYGET
jgi:choline dehydrogenase-like flavoprotein